MQLPGFHPCSVGKNNSYWTAGQPHEGFEFWYLKWICDFPGVAYGWPPNLCLIKRFVHVSLCKIYKPKNQWFLTKIAWVWCKVEGSPPFQTHKQMFPKLWASSDFLECSNPRDLSCKIWVFNRFLGVKCSSNIHHHFVPQTSLLRVVYLTKLFIATSLFTMIYMRQNLQIHSWSTNPPTIPHRFSLDKPPPSLRGGATA